jgi:rubrerythrin
MNTEQWLNKVLSSKEELNHWLQRQYVGEVTAANRIHSLALAAPYKHFKVLSKIASDELNHATWVLDLLEAREIPLPKIESAEDRYWKPILGEAEDDFDKTAAAGFHAEGMRLVRIRALANDARVDQDIRDVFARILPDEEYHEKAFGAIASERAKAVMANKHEEGLNRLGLEI